MIKAYKFFKKYYKYDFRFYLYIFCSFGAKITMLVIPYLTKELIDQIQFKNLNRFKCISFYLILVMIFFGIFLSLKYYFQNYVELSILNELKEDMIKRIFNIKNEKLKSMSIGEVIQKIFIDTETARPLIISTYIECFLNIVYTCVIIIIMFSMNINITLLLLALIPIFIFFYKIYAPKIEKTNKKIISEDENIKSLAEENLTGNLDIKVNNAYSFVNDRIKDKLKSYFEFGLNKTKYIMQYDYILVTGIMNFATLLIYCFGGYLVFKSIISIGTLVSFTLYFSRLWDPVEYFMELSKEVKVQMVSLNRIKAFFRIEFENSGNDEILPEFEKLKFNNVTFSYDDRVIFKNLNLEITSGETIAIKGGNGTGKSTLASIITKLLTEYDGEIYYNDLNYKVIDYNSIRKKIIFIPSKTFLFNGSIFENITLKANSSNIELDNFTKNWHVEQLVNILKNNKRSLKTIVNNKSNNLSGGEQKIIQLLRGIFLNGDVYILDEPLNYIDKTYKKILLDFIRFNLASKTVIIISHDEDIFKCCNKIYTITNNTLMTCK